VTHQVSRSNTICDETFFSIFLKQKEFIPLCETNHIQNQRPSVPAKKNSKNIKGPSKTTPSGRNDEEPWQPALNGSSAV
jgi:hypothetical protein